MTDHPPAGDSPAGAMAAFLQDCHTIWLSELQALASDRELIEAWDRWAKIDLTPIASCPVTWLDGAAAVSGPDAPARAASAGPAPDPGDAAIHSLERRIADLERRLDAYAAGPGDTA